MPSSERFRLRADNLDKAIEYFEYSLKSNEHNPEAQKGLALIYHNQAMVKAQTEELDEALKLAQSAMQYEADPATARLLVAIVTDLAVQRFRKGRIQQGADLFPSIFKYAEQGQDLVQYTHAARGIMGVLVDLSQYELAIRWLELVEDTSYDEEIFDVCEALSSS